MVVPLHRVSDLNFDLRRISELASRVPNCIRSDLGQLNYPFPEKIKTLMEQQVLLEKFEYAPTLGNENLLKALDVFEAPVLQNFTEPKTLVTSGGQAALFATLSAFVNTGDTILTDQLYYPPYASIAPLLGASLQAQKLINLNLKNLDPVKVLLLNTPHNPSGKVYELSELKVLASLAKQQDWLVIEDRVYDRLYETEFPASIATYAPERTLVINSASKNFCMPGMRLGWVFGENNLVTNVAKVHRNMNSCPNTFFQSVLAQFLPHSEAFFVPLRHELSVRKQLMLKGFNNLGWSVFPSQGGIYMMVEIPKVTDGEAFVENLISQVGVSVVPGSFFGSKTNTFRFCFGALTSLQMVEMFKQLARFKN